MIEVADLFRFLIALGTTFSGIAVYIAREASKRTDNLERRLDACLEHLIGDKRQDK